MPGPVKTDDERWRKMIVHWTIEAPLKLSAQSCQTLAKKATFKKFISYVAEQAPGTMGPFLKRVVKKMPVASVDDCNTGSKRSAAERDENRKAKKAKFEKTKDFGCEDFGSKCDFEDCGGTEPNTKTFETGSETALDAEESADCPLQLVDYTMSEIEIGLVEADPKFRKLFMAEFAKIPRNSRNGKDGSRVLLACKKLRSEEVIIELCRFLRSASKRPHAVPQGYDVEDLQEIVQTLHQIGLAGRELGIHNAFVQTLLSAKVDSMIDNQQFHNDKEVIDHLTECYIRSSAGKGQEFQQVKEKHCADYNRGKKWLDIAKAFDGTGIVLAIVATGIGASTVSEGWTIFERACFEKMADYLPGLKEVVKILGADALKQYCQNCLPVGKIQELEQLNDPASDEEDEDEVQDNHSDGESGSDSDGDD